MNRPLDVYIGYDTNNSIVSDVCAFSMARRSSIPVRIRSLRLHELRQDGLYFRTVDPLAATEFTYSRYLVPFLNGYRDLALFCDNDFLWLGDIAQLVAAVDPGNGVTCVQHNHRPTETTKMSGQTQTTYPRKNWSSMMLFQCGDEGSQRLTVEAANKESGAYLHRMQWMPDERIGAVRETWNWLDGDCAKPEIGTPNAVHYTRGGPWYENWQHVDYADLWVAERDAWEAAGKPTVEPARAPQAHREDS